MHGATIRIDYKLTVKMLVRQIIQEKNSTIKAQTQEI